MVSGLRLEEAASLVASSFREVQGTPLAYLREVQGIPLAYLAQGGTRDSVCLPLRRLGPFSFSTSSGPGVASSSSPQGFPLSFRAQLGRVGGSRWGWVLEIK